MRKLSHIFQEILKFILVFLLSFIWIRYYVKKLWLATITSLIVSTGVFTILHFIDTKKQTKTKLKLKEKAEAENMFLSLACSNNPMLFFENLTKKQHENITKHKEYLVINHPENVKTVLFPYINFEDLNNSALIKIYNKVKKENATKIVVCCKSISEETILFSENFTEKFLLLDEYQTYQKLYKLYDFYPTITHKYNSEKKLIFKDLISHSFNKKRTKGYLFSAFVLVFCSLFVPSSLYYCIWASMLIVFAIISQFNPKFNKNQDDKPF